MTKCIIWAVLENKTLIISYSNIAINVDIWNQVIRSFEIYLIVFRLRFLVRTSCGEILNLNVNHGGTESTVLGWAKMMKSRSVEMHHKTKRHFTLNRFWKIKIQTTTQAHRVLQPLHFSRTVKFNLHRNYPLTSNQSNVDFKTNSEPSNRPVKTWRLIRVGVRCCRHWTGPCDEEQWMKV